MCNSQLIYEKNNMVFSGCFKISLKDFIYINVDKNTKDYFFLQ